MDATLGLFLEKLRDQFEEADNHDITYQLNEMLNTPENVTYEDLDDLVMNLVDSPTYPWDRYKFVDVVNMLLDWGGDGETQLRRRLGRSGRSDPEIELFIIWMKGLLR